MRAGKLRHRVYVEIPKETGKDDRGQPIVTWQRARDWQCSVNRLSGRQLEIARQMYTDATHEVEGRWFPNLHETHRLVFKGRILNIRDVEDVEEINKSYRLTVAEDRVS